MKRQKLTILLVIANLCLLTFYVSGWTSGKARAPRLQNDEKTVSKHFTLKNEPIEVTELKIKDRAVKLGDVVKGESDWLEHLEFKIKNRSKRPITLLQIDLDFPETKATGSIMMHQLFIGQSPELGSSSNNQPLHLKPSESVRISLGPEYMNIKRLLALRQHSIENISKVVIRLGEVMFEDGARYSGGNIFKHNPDQNNPRKWILVTDAEATYLNN